MQTTLRSETAEVHVQTDGPIVIIGERINPTGHRRLAEELHAGRFDYLGEIAAAQVAAAADVFITIELLRKELGVHTVVGASNVSFGLPARDSLNSAFLGLAAGAEVNCVITDPMKFTALIRAADLLRCSDSNAKRYKAQRNFPSRLDRPPSDRGGRRRSRCVGLPRGCAPASPSAWKQAETAS